MLFNRNNSIDYNQNSKQENRFKLFIQEQKEIHNNKNHLKSQSKIKFLDKDDEGIKYLEDKLGITGKYY